MKKIILLSLLYGIILSYAWAQDEVKIIKTEAGINTIGTNNISIKLFFEIPKDHKFVDSKINRLYRNERFSLKLFNNNVLFETSTTTAIGAFVQGGLVFLFKDVDDEFLEYIVKSQNEHHIEIERDDLEIVYATNKDTIIEKITKQQIIESTRNKLHISQDKLTLLEESLSGNVGKMTNNFDFGIIPGEESDTDKTEFYVSFNYNKAYKLNKKVMPFAFSANGLLSTNSSDSLNYLSIYPLNYHFKQYNKDRELKDYDFLAQIGIEGNQRFTNYRVSADVSFQTLLPDLIDLTSNANRLRLKPVFKAGLKLYKEVENNRLDEQDNEASGQLFFETYYYVPIQKIYSLKLNANAFYDFSEVVNPEEEFKYNISLELGIEIPNTEFKTIFKYINGENGISYQKDELLTIGLMADFV